MEQPGMSIERRVDVVSETHPRFQSFVSLHHPDIVGDVLWVRGPRRFTRKGALADIPECERALSFQLTVGRKMRARA